MLQPKRTKFRKQFKGRNRGLATTGSKVSFGEFGRVLYEMEGVTETIAREAFRLASAKIPFKTSFVSRTVM